MSRNYPLSLRRADIGDIVPRHWQHDRLLISVELTLTDFDDNFSELTMRAALRRRSKHLKKASRTGEATINSLARRYKQIKQPC
jgi:hypothetical protein